MTNSNTLYKLFVNLFFKGEIKVSTEMQRDRRHPLRDNAYLLHFRTGLGYGSISFPIKPCLYISRFFLSCKKRAKEMADFD